MNKFLEFINDTPTAYHAVKELKEILLNYGYVEIIESDKWNLKSGGKYFMSRNMSSLVAFTIPEDEIKAFNISAAHLDSPTFKLKPNFNLDKGRYLKFNTEVYGGPIYNTWMDRPLGIAGRVIISQENKLQSKLINIKEGVCFIPNLPIHYNRNVNKGVELNPQVDLLPIFADKTIGQASLNKIISKNLNIVEEEIISSDLYLTNLDRGMLVGANKEFIMAPQIDNLECSYSLIKALIASENKTSCNICALFDSEEIGSSTIQGADSTLLEDVINRICHNLDLNYEEKAICLANSFMVSADNAQGYHPNYPSKYDETNACYLNEGIVIKNAARGSYSTDGLSRAYFQMICKKANVKYQLNTNRSDVLGGSTLGAISLRHISIPSIDIGLAQLAMHSAYETAGTVDLKYLISAMTEFYNNTRNVKKEEEIII